MCEFNLVDANCQNLIN